MVKKYWYLNYKRISAQEEFEQFVKLKAFWQGRLYGK
jgi:hypothetical protein